MKGLERGLWEGLEGDVDGKDVNKLKFQKKNKESNKVFGANNYMLSFISQ